MEKRTMFRWHINHDVDLLKEAVAIRPKQPTDWNIIADNLQRAWIHEQIIIKGRSCKAHFDVLLHHHKDGNADALKKSGTEEQYTEVQQLLDDIVSYITDLKIQQSKNNKKDADDKQKGVELRDKAMETLKRKSSTSNSNSDSEDDGASPNRKTKEKPKTKRSKHPDVMSYLAGKKEAETKLRDKELQYKCDALEAETKLKQEALDLEKKRVALQEQQMNMQLELMKALINSKKD